MDSMNVPSELISLCGKVRDETISTEEFKRFEAMLLADTNALSFYREFVSVYSGLEQIAHADTEQSEQGEQNTDDEFDWTDDLEKLSPVSEFVHPVEEQREAVVEDRKHRGAIIAGVLAALAASIAFALLTRRTDGQADGYASLVDSYHAVWGDGEPSVRLGGDYVLLSGAAKLRYDNGAELLLQAPAEFSIDEAGQASLDRGSLRLYVPPAATGFQIKTPYGRVIDRGTRIGVFAHADLGLEVHVFEGRAEAIRKSTKLGHGEQSEPSPNGTGEMLIAGQAIAIPVAGGVPATRIPANPVYFADPENPFEHLPVVSGDIEMMVSPPRSVRRIRSELSDLGRAIIFPEQKNVGLTEDVLVSLIDPADTDLLQRRDQNIPAGNRVDSFMVHFAVPKAQRRGNHALFAKGTIQFPRPVLGIACDRPAELSERFGDPDTDYPLDRGTGLEDSIDGDPEKADRIQWSDDRKTLSFSLRTHGREESNQPDFVDQFRILIESAP